MSKFNISFSERRSENDKKSVEIIRNEHQHKFGEETPSKFYKAQQSDGPVGTEKEDIVLKIMTPLQKQVDFFPRNTDF